MQYHVSSVKHEPERGNYGDCLRASFACILNKPRVEDVPHFYHDGCSAEVGTQRIEEYLKSENLGLLMLHFPGDLQIEHVTGALGLQNPDLLYLLFGRNKYDEQHVVIYKGIEKIHDVAWYQSSMRPGKNGLWTIATIVPAVVIDR